MIHSYGKKDVSYASLELNVVFISRAFHYFKKSSHAGTGGTSYLHCSKKSSDQAAFFQSVIMECNSCSRFC